MILSVDVKDTSYDIIVEKGCLSKASEYLDLNRKVLIITDSKVPSKYSEVILKQCSNGYIYTFESGEENKNFSTYKDILSFLIDKSFTRSDCIVAVGGGVVGDLSGFVASTYMRGIDFYNIPTTLLAQVDSSIGGKTAIDFEGVKNIIGAFYQPKKVLIDSTTLLTLDHRLLSAGLAESIKMAATFSEELFEIIKCPYHLMDKIDDIIIKSLKIKKYVVENDPYEKNLRRVLNFGHTIGHGIEASLNGALYHGECVALGMLYFCSEEVKSKLIDVYSKYDLPISFDFNKDAAYKYITLDKKGVGDYINVIKCEKIGTFEIVKVHKNDIHNFLGGSNE